MPPTPLPTLSGNIIADFFRGLTLPFRAASLLATRPRLWPLVLIPLTLNLVLFFVLFIGGFAGFSAALETWLDGLTAWYWTALLWTAEILFPILVLILIYFIFAPTALIIAAPFNDRLAENTERICNFAMTDNRPFLKMVFSESLFIILSESKRLAIILSVFVLLFPLNIIPGIGSIIYGTLSFTWASWCTTWEFSSYAADRRHLGLRAKWRLMRQNLGATFGFGILTASLMIIPFLNVLLVPVSAVAGTMLFGMMEKRQ